MNTEFYVYAYLDPRKTGRYVYNGFSFDYEPFYVGKGKGKRIIDGMNEKGRTFKHNKIMKIYSLNLEPIKIKLHEDLDEYTAFHFEKVYIKEIGRSDLKLGPLTNLTDGGEGDELTDDIKKKISNSLKKKYREGMTNSNLGKSMSDEQKTKISKSKIGSIPWNKGIRYNMGENHYLYGKHRSEETKKKISQTKTGNTINSIETRKKLSAKAHLQWAKYRFNKLNEQLEFLNWQNFCQKI